MDFVEEREDEIRDRKVVTWEVVDYDEAPCDEEFIPPDNDSLYCEDIRKSWLLSWMAEMRSLSDDEDDVDPPPLFILDYPGKNFLGCSLARVRVGGLARGRSFSSFPVFWI